MSDTQILLPNAAFATEVSTTAIAIALGAGGLLQLSGNTGSPGANLALLTFNAAHQYTKTTNANGTVTIRNTSTKHGPSLYGYTYGVLSGAVALASGYTFAILDIPSTTTMTIWHTLTGTNPTVTALSFYPVWCTSPALYNYTFGANCNAQYNPDNTGSPALPPAGVTPGTVPTVRALAAVSTAGNFQGDGAGQIQIVASGASGTSYWSLQPK